MIPVAAHAERVLLDTSALVSFAQARQLFYLVQYLGQRGSVALDVQVEIERHQVGRFPDLKTLAMLRWPPGGPLALPADLLVDARDLRRLHRQPGEHPDANAGEIATVLLAARLGALAVLDDRLGRRLARFRGLPFLTTPQLAAEMVATGAIDADMALAVFRAARHSAAPADVEAAVAAAREALGR
ncbi:MAG: hypothetical protein IRZ32_10420 [Solirubrobacteraceae bacterium]|nr:hypothetical protein [Solirubrobacteraceae bacterium]